MLLQLNSTDIKKPNKANGFYLERFEISEAKRVASGKMTKDIVAVKRKFYFQYAVIEKVDLDVIMNILTNGDAFFTLDYEDGGDAKQATVYVGAIKKYPFHATAIAGYSWKDFTFNLIEQ